MTSLYHMVPKKMSGTVLYPLNQLRGRMPEMYAEHVAKYAGREAVMEQHIPVLDCLWNDVLHFTAVDPEIICQALREAGRVDSIHWKLYRVDPSRLDPSVAVVYRCAHKKREDALAPENFAPFAAETLEEYAQLPEATRVYYHRMIEKGERPLLFHRVPHILYKGTLDMAEIPVVEIGLA
jgi:hypothetical protein